MDLEWRRDSFNGLICPCKIQENTLEASTANSLSLCGVYIYNYLSSHKIPTFLCAAQNPMVNTSRISVFSMPESREDGRNGDKETVTWHLLSWEALLQRTVTFFLFSFIFFGLVLCDESIQERL